MKIVYFLTLSLLFITPSITFGLAYQEKAPSVKSAEMTDRLQKLEALISKAQQEKQARLSSSRTKRAVLGGLNLLVAAIAGAGAYYLAFDADQVIRDGVDVLSSDQKTKEFVESNFPGVAIPRGKGSMETLAHFLNSGSMIADSPLNVNKHLRKGALAGALSVISLLCGVKGANLLYKAAFNV